MEICASIDLNEIFQQVHSSDEFVKRTLSPSYIGCTDPEVWDLIFHHIFGEMPVDEGKETLARKGSTDPRWDILYHEMHCSVSKYESFCKKLCR